MQVSDFASQPTRLAGTGCGWTLPQKRPMLALCKVRSTSSRVTECIAALSRCCFYRFQISRLLFQKVWSKNQSAKWIWFRCSQTTAPVPCLRNTERACITLLGSEATAQLICNYSTSWWPETLCHVIWASASQPSVSMAVKNMDAQNIPTSFNIQETKLCARNQLSKDLNTCTYISSLGNGKGS